jgi:hypothetical protein
MIKMLNKLFSKSEEEIDLVFENNLLNILLKDSTLLFYLLVYV